MTISNLDSNSQDVQNEISEVSKSYPSWFRKLEWIGLISIFILFILLICKSIFIIQNLWFVLFLGGLCGWIGADFACGFVHWLADTWGSTEIPILGAAVIRPFREHHANQMAMTKHDFVETNAAAALGGVPLLIGCLFIPIGPTKPVLSFVFFGLFFLTFFGFLTNQIHKWAHSKKVHKFIRILQKRHLILNPIHHQIHHTAPYNRYYCITTGWLNRFLSAINFFPTCEKLITKYTGALPRQDDIGKNAAISVISANSCLKETVEHHGTTIKRTSQK